MPCDAPVITATFCSAPTIDLPTSRRQPSQIKDDVALGLRAADQHVAVRRRIDRVGPVADRPRHKSGLTGVAHPVRHDHRTGTSLASASSSKLWNVGPQRTLRPLRANETSAPKPGGPAGKCGSRRGEAAMPRVMDGPAPKLSVWMRSGATPKAARPAIRSLMKVGGPQI